MSGEITQRTPSSDTHLDLGTEDHGIYNNIYFVVADIECVTVFSRRMQSKEKVLL